MFLRSGRPVHVQQRYRRPHWAPDGERRGHAALWVASKVQMSDKRLTKQMLPYFCRSGGGTGAGAGAGAGGFISFQELHHRKLYYAVVIR